MFGMYAFSEAPFSSLVGLSSGWTPTIPGIETWTPVTAGTETWTDITPSSDTWIQQG
jgi:hypothetical protein